jgi:isopenicillin-N N-acyltransferase-like protein
LQEGQHTMFPILDLSGSPYERGLAHGQLARDQVAGSVRCYAALFANAGFDWTDAQKRASQYRDTIAECGGGLIDELEGIAKGSGFGIHEILALNCRTEILPPSTAGLDPSAATAARAHNAGLKLFSIGECTSVAVQGRRCTDGHTRVAQNWDWVGFQRQNVVVLRVSRNDGPDYLTLTEAGMLAKIGINRHGLGVGLNILRATNDRQHIGVPVHVFQRLALECSNVAEVVNLAQRLTFSGSSNAILGDASGTVASLEYSCNGTYVVTPDNGVVTHTNHFAGPALAPYQTSLADMFTTVPRLACANANVQTWPAQIDDSHLQALLRDESGEGDNPKINAVCRWPDLTQPVEVQVETVFSVIIDCDTRSLLVAPDIPSRVGYVGVGL